MKNKTTAGLLALFLGGWGVHYFYIGNNNKAVAYLLVTIFGLGVGAFVIEIMSIIDAIGFFSMTDEEFEKIYIGNERENSVGSNNQKKTANNVNDELTEKYQKLKRYKELLDMNAITEEDFSELKNKILA